MDREFIEDIILGMGDMVYENRRLREENYEMKMRLKKYDDQLNKSYERSQQQVTNIFNTIVDKITK